MYNNEDRSWMYDRSTDSGCLNSHFENGVGIFLDYAFSQTNLLNRGKAKCPCRMCANCKYLKRDKIQHHLYTRGFIPQYLVWTVHGETHNSCVATNTYVGESSSRNVMDQYRNMVDDAFGGRFEHVNYNQREQEEPNPEAQAFFELLRASQVPIHPGVETTILQWVSKFLTDKVQCNITGVASERHIQSTLSVISPAYRHRLPDSLYKVKKLMKSLGLGYRTFDVCVNNCFLFYGEFESVNWTACPHCQQARFKKRRNMNNRNKPISRKKLWYLPLTPRLQRLYMSRTIAEHMTWHLKCRGDTDHMIHPASGEAWKFFDRTYPDFANEPRNVRLGICTDGFTPYGNFSAPYSCWPVFVTPYNLPPDLCMRQENIFLSLIISGPKSPGKNIDVLLRPLIDELQSLWNDGVQTYDSFRKQNFQMRASVLWTISDFPAYGMLSQWSTHGRLSCPYCMENTKSFQLQHGRKTSFFDCHRRFLPPEHPWRLNRRDFIKDRVEEDAPLPRRLGAEMWEHVCGLPPVGFGASREYIEGFGKTHNWCRRSIFWELPYWKTNLIRHNLDVMHCEKNFFENIKNTVMDDPEKTKDNMNSRRDLQLLTTRSNLFLLQGRDGRQYKRKAVYCLSREQKIEVLEWLNGLCFPDGYASNISRCIQMDKLRLAGMKSHDCHVFMQRLMPIAFRDFLPDRVWGPLVEVSNFFRALCATEIRKSDMELLEMSFVETMCKLEKIFPPSFFDSMEHLAIHLPWEAKVGGPVQYRWMYPFERRMFELKRSARNKARIEGSICETNLLFEIASFSSYYFEMGIETRFNRLNRNETEQDPTSGDQLSVFQKKGRPLGSTRGSRFLTAEEYQAIELYVLQNCTEVDCWIRMFDESMCVGLTGHQLQQRRNDYLVQWFKDCILSGRYVIDPRLHALAQGPLWKAHKYNGYIINGFRFHTEAYGQEMTTMNSGVCVKATIGGPDETNFYGMLQEVLELDFWGSGNLQTIVLFKCIWYDVTEGMNVHQTYRLVDINPNLRLETGTSEPFILANQAQQVYYTPYPSQQNRLRRGWWAVCTTRARYVVDTSSLNEQNDHENEAPDVYQEIIVPILEQYQNFRSDNVIQLAENEVVPAVAIVEESSESDEDIEDEDENQGGTYEDQNEDDSDSDYV